MRDLYRQNTTSRLYLRSQLLIAIIIFVGTLIPYSVQAETIRIVALGASNTKGKGVAARSAWPAQLETMLRAKGYDARVANEGINGDDTRRMRARLDSAVPAGTQIVILDRPTSNDRKRHINTKANHRAMTTKLHNRGIKTIVIAGNHKWANWKLQSDGIHVTAEGHRAIASKLLSRVVRMIGKRKKR